MIPGSNLLNRAMQTIASQEVEYLEFDKNITSPDGSKIPSFKEAVKLKGSFQPVASMTKQYLGLNLSENYANFYVSAAVKSFTRARSTDRIRFAGKLYQVASESDWHAVDGWKAVLLIEVLK